MSDEAYYPESQVAEVIDEKSGEKYMVRPTLAPHSRQKELNLRLQASTETGTRVEWMEEENYKFRLSAFREPLLEWLTSKPHRSYSGLNSAEIQFANSDSYSRAAAFTHGRPRLFPHPPFFHRPERPLHLPPFRPPLLGYSGAR